MKAGKKTEYVKNYAQIESVLNHIHILDLFTVEQRDESDYEQIKYLGNKLCEIYAAKLKIEFPGREFTVVSNFEEEMEDFMDYEFSFYQNGNITRKVQ